MNGKPIIKSTVKPSFPAKMDLSVGKGVNTRLQAIASNPAQTLQLVKPSSNPLTKPVARAPAVPMGLGMDSSTFRARMVSKLASHGITDTRVLNAMQTTHRHSFVDTALANQAYEDTSLPIGWGQTISKPNVVARMIELLFEGKTGNLGRVLEIGTGCGYQAAVMAQCTPQVCSVERVAGLAAVAKTHLVQHNIKNIALLHGDGTQPWRTQFVSSHGNHAYERFDAIVVAAAGLGTPQTWLDQLHIGGRLIAPVQDELGVQRLHLIERRSESQFDRYFLETVQFVPLLGGTTAHS